MKNAQTQILLLLLPLLIGSFLLPSGKPSTYVYNELPLLTDNQVHQVTKNAPGDFFVFSHGRPGALLLMGEWKEGRDLAAWLKEHIAPGSRALRIFGCEFGKGRKGREAVARLQQALNLPVSASDNITGKDGDWRLEVGEPYTLPGLENYPFNLQCPGGTVGGTGSGDDFDGDGKCNDVDIDDDNDGTPDAIESTPLSCETAFPPGKRVAPWTMSPDSKSATASITIEGKTVEVTASITPSSSTGTAPFFQLRNQSYGFGAGRYDGCPDAQSAITNSTIDIQQTDYTVTYTFSKPVKNPTLSLSSFNTTVNFPQPVYVSGLQGTVTGVALGSYVTSIPNSENIISLVYNGVYNSISFTVPGFDNLGAVLLHLQEVKDAGTATYTETADAPFGYKDIDTDGDDIVNRFDLDSDNDGCSDAREADATTDTTANYRFTGTDANGNGLVDIVQKDAGDGINYTSTYKSYAVMRMLNACTDTDGDGVNNINDIDDDNDGVPDAVEAPGCYYNSKEAIIPASVATSLTSTVNNVAVVRNTDIPTLRDGVATDVSASNHVITTGQPFAGLNIYTIVFPTVVNLGAVQVVGGTDNWGAGTEAALYGSNDSASWTPLMSAPLNTTTGTTKTFTVNQHAAQYRYYQVRGTAGTSAAITNYEVTGTLNADVYNPSVHPKSACAVDTDGDDIPNNRDLDSDGDGCSDALEAGATTDTTANYRFNGADANGNGLADALEDGTGGNVNYSSTYNRYAVESTINACMDTDGDAVRDMTDMDDDNDGVPDETEDECAFQQSSKAGIIVSAPSNVTYNYNGSIAQLVDGADNNAYVISAPSGTLNNAPLLTVKFPQLSMLTYFEVGHYNGQTLFSTTSTYKIQASTDSLNWTDVTDTLTYHNVSTTTSGGYSSYNSNIARIATAGKTYRYYRMYGINVANGGGWATELYFKEYKCNKPDTDNDGIVNRLDPDSDNDGCSDALEAGATTDTTANYRFSGADANGNGLADALEDGTGSNVNYASTYKRYAVERTINACMDTDGDAVRDVTDIDDDNDGVPDETEDECAFQQSSKAGIIVSAPSNVTYNYNGSIAQLVDGIDNGIYIMHNPTGALNDAPLLTVKFPQPSMLTYFEVGHYNGQTLFSTTSTYKIQASTDSLNWTDVTDTLTYHNVSTTTSGGYSSYNSNIARIATAGKTYRYYRMYGISVTNGGGWATELYFKEYKCNKPDTDSDGVVNRLDPDSDNDGCSDALEAGATTDTTANYQFTGTDANGNGLIDIVQKDAGDSINYTSTYKPYAVNNMVNACTDTDGDDVNNIKDLDDDNDGVLDAVEAPGCYYTSAGAAAPLSVSTSTVSTVKSAPVVKGANIPTLHDGVTASASASNHVIAINQSLTGANIYTIAYPTAVSLSAVEVIGGTANWGARTAAALYGSNDSTSWAPLMSAPLNTTTGTTKTFTVNQNAAQYRYYQVRGTAGNSATITNYEVRGILNASTYNASAHPKNTCTTDTDNDGIINTADLDSDGDGCSDAVEAKVAKRSGGPVMQPGGLKNGSNGNVTSEKNTSKAVVSGPYGNNGFANSVETSDESGMYNSTYTYAKATDGSPDIDCATFSEVLPFRLLKFTVRAANESVMLTWKTTNEVNNDYFEVERSADGAAWTVIGRVKAHNRPGVHRYVLRDAGPVKGEAYYRLKQRNFDGTYTYSKVEMVNKTPGVLLKLYPNPAYNYIMVTMAVLRPADITVWNVLGKNVTTRVIIKQMDAGKLNLYIEGLTSGIYIIKAKGKAAAFVKMD